ncbi:MAG TPA: extracellular solute-binding protein [Candidatus Angelobacter sp.]|nr:extracellular solute-binding protein [Candidatus Angelobacter sp.]
MNKLNALLHRYVLLALCLLLAASGCRKTSESSGTGTGSRALPANSIELVFTYGSEKEKWIKDVTDSFNRIGRKTSSGKQIVVTAIPMGSGECIDEILSGTRKTHITSPASAAFVKIGNAQSRARTGKDLLGPTDNLVLSPVVIAMWRPMAEAIGWGKKPIGWADILSLARNQQGWKTYGFPQWGQFKFGHTHPDYSNSGLISLFAETYAAVNKKAGLTVADVNSPRTGQFLAGIENSVVHYGSSTGFFGRKMFANGPQYLSAAVLYESMVVESYDQQNLAFPVVAIYPKEGTFWSDHPIGIVDREWVTPEHREAARIYTQYLLDRPQQEHALMYGFRPASLEVPVGAPLDATHGMDAKEPKTTLEVPSPEVINAIRTLWLQKKKSAEVVLVFDTSGSMNEGQKIQNAREGAKQLVSLLGDNDTFSLLPFNSRMSWASQDISMKQGRTQSVETVNSLFAEGGTALYDAISAAYAHLLERQANDANHDSKIRAVVVLTDGADTESHTHLDQLMQQIRFDGEQHTIRVFTIAYGNDAKHDILNNIAEATQAKSYDGTPKNIVDVFRDISTFF